MTRTRRSWTSPGRTRSHPDPCHLDGLSDVGACRLCVVEVTGATKLFAACVTKVEEGMNIVTNSPRLHEYRKTTIEMLFTERNHVCSVCVANNHCELQRLGKERAYHFDLPLLEPLVEIDATHKRFVIDHNRCILCTRCVRICDEIEGAHTWDILIGVPGAAVITDMGTPWGRLEDLHELWQVRPGLPNRGPVREGPLRCRGQGQDVEIHSLPQGSRAGLQMTKANLATVWLDGCSGCHMSFLDMDDRLLDIAGRANLVYSPLVDVKEFPLDVDVTLVEGAVSSTDDLERSSL